MTYSRVATLAACVALSVVTWLGMNVVKHAINDHTVLHQLVQIEVARQAATK